MKYLILGPSVMGVYAILGYLKHTELGNIKEISASSSGCLLAFFILLGYTIDEILDIFLNVPITQFTQINIKNLFKTYGLICHENTKNFLKTFSKDAVVSFEDLFKKSGIIFHVAAYCININKTVYFSVVTHPQMSVIDAMMMSISVPLLFGAVKYKGMHYLDGGTVEEIPLGPFMGKPVDDVFVIKIKKTLVNSEFEIKNIKDYFVCLMKNIIYKITIADQVLIKNTIVIDLEHINIFDFKMNHADIFRLFLLGQSLNHSGLTM